MIPGAFTFLMFIFSSPQEVLTHKLEGVWEVTEDRTDSKREYWNKIYTFESCDDVQSMQCPGFYGWVDEPDVLTNLLDKNYFIYGISKKKAEGSKSRILFLDDESYHFVLKPGKGILQILYENDELLMILKKRD